MLTHVVATCWQTAARACCAAGAPAAALRAPPSRTTAQRCQLRTKVFGRDGQAERRCSAATRWRIGPRRRLQPAAWHHVRLCARQGRALHCRGGAAAAAHVLRRVWKAVRSLRAAPGRCPQPRRRAHGCPTPPARGAPASARARRRRRRQPGCVLRRHTRHCCTYPPWPASRAHAMRSGLPGGGGCGSARTATLRHRGRVRHVRQNAATTPPPPPKKSTALEVHRAVRSRTMVRDDGRPPARAAPRYAPPCCAAPAGVCGSVLAAARGATTPELQKGTTLAERPTWPARGSRPTRAPPRPLWFGQAARQPHALGARVPCLWRMRARPCSWCVL